MKATLTYKLPEDQEDFKIACDSKKWVLLVWKLETHIRYKLNKEDLFLLTAEMAVEQISKKLYELLDESNLSLDDIT